MIMRKSLHFSLYVTLTAILIAFGCRKTAGTGAGSDPTDLLPENDDISGFKKKGSAAIMTDYQTIMDAIDGAAEKFIDYGFVEGAQQMYSNGSVDIDIHIMNHGTEENAKKIFEELRPSSPEVISTGVPEVVIDHSFLTGYALYYMRDNIYMEIITYEKSNFALNMAKQFVWNIDKKIASR